MPTHYLAEAAGRIVSRKSTRNDFTHAVFPVDMNGQAVPDIRIPSFGTSEGGAVANFNTSHREGTRYRCVALRIVDAAEYRAATKGIDPHTGKPKA